jgi:hypothetical protein
MVRTRTRKLKKERPFWPPKYYRGLTRKQKLQRKKEIERFGAKGWKDPKAYTGFKTNTIKKTKSSGYTQVWNSMFPEAKSLKERSEVTGVPEDILEESYNRGMAAWRTGHRPGATQQQWGYARVSSLLLLGKTSRTADADLVEKAKKKSNHARSWFKKMEKESPFYESS